MIYRFHQFVLDTQEYTFSQNSEAVSLEPKVFDLLVYLVENRDRIVSKEELIEKIWGGRVISDSALNTCVRSVRRALQDDREKQAFVRTFPKRGFQFVGFIQGDSDEDNPEDKHSRTLLFSVTALIFTALFIFIYLKFIQTEDATYLSDRPSIAILDFKNNSGNDDQQYFTEGLIEELVSSLSHYRELFVISRRSSMLYKDSNASIREIGYELGAEYIVNGNIRYNGEDIHVAVHMMDSNSGQQLWSTKIDTHRGDIYSVQSELAYLIAGQVFPELVRVDTEKNSKNPPEVLDAWALYHKARALQAVYKKEKQEQAIDWANLALQRDPNLAAAHGVIARAKGVQFFYQWTDNRGKTLQEAIASAKTAISLDQNDAGGYAALGYVFRYTGDEISSLSNLKRATVLNPSDANIRLEYAHTLDWFRHQEKALPEINQAIRLSPRDPRLENMLFYKAHIQFHLHQYEASLATTKVMSGVLTTDTWRMFYHLMRSANLAQLDREQQAQQHVDVALKIKPGLSIAAMRKQFEGSKNHPENRRFWLESLEKAGIPAI